MSRTNAIIGSLSENRSSLAQKLGLTNYDSTLITQRSDGLAQLALESLDDINKPLSLTLLYHWHQLLFNEQNQLAHSIRVDQLRGPEPMQVISSRLDKPKTHFEAPPREQLEKELHQFINWVNQPHTDIHPYIKAGITHLWFLTIHPFDDGNGRLARTLTDRMLAMSDQQTIRLFSLSNAILAERKAYYDILEKTQKCLLSTEPLDITPWLLWFIELIQQSIAQSLTQIEHTINKAKFWLKHQHTQLSAEQRKVLNRMLDGGEQGFTQGMNASQYQKVAKVSKATASCHLSYLVEQGCLLKSNAGGRSTRYWLTMP